MAIHDARNLFKLLIFPTVWNLLSLGQHSQFLTSYLSPGLCLISKTSQKDTSTDMYTWSLRSHLSSELCSPRTMPFILSPGLEGQVQVPHSWIPKCLKGFQLLLDISIQMSYRNLRNSEVKNESTFHLYVQTFSSPIISYTWSPSHNQSATNPCQFH